MEDLFELSWKFQLATWSRSPCVQLHNLEAMMVPLWSTTTTIVNPETWRLIAAGKNIWSILHRIYCLGYSYSGIFSPKVEGSTRGKTEWAAKVGEPVTEPPAVPEWSKYLWSFSPECGGIPREKPRGSSTRGFSLWSWSRHTWSQKYMPWARACAL